MKKRNVQMRIEGMNSFACSFGVDDRDALEQALRGFSFPTHVWQLVLGTTLHVLRFWGSTLACKAFPSMVRQSSLFMFSTGRIDGEEFLGRHSMTGSSLLAYCIATPSARIAGSPSMRKINLFPSPCSQVFDHRRDYVCSWSIFLNTDCCHHAESNVQHVQDGEQLLSRCVLHETVVGHDDRELWFFVWLSVMWIV